MATAKRKPAPASNIEKYKKQKTANGQVSKRNKSDDAAEEEDFAGILSNTVANGHKDIERKEARTKQKQDQSKTSKTLDASNSHASQKFKLETTSAEAHAKQRALTKERKLNKPNADAIQRAKQLWEKLRRKSHVPPDERKKLVTELFGLIEGRVRDFVFKHDSVRVVQCALKYANREQRQKIAEELLGDIRTLAESRYGKFLVAKMVVEGDQPLRNAIVPEFYGHVRRLINHPEASWIVDDIYRQVASADQKATMLREWYGAEFALFHRKPDAKVDAVATQDTADLTEILKQSPEKRKPITQYLLQMINALVQKKMTGFTMLHDAMLQYFLVLPPGSSEHQEFLEILNGDIDAESEGGGGDLFKNLAFTKSGSRLVCLALAYGSAKTRRAILRVFKDTVETMAFDTHAKLVLLTGLEVTDDTKMSSKAIFHELLGLHIQDESERLERVEQIVTNLNARLPVLFCMAGPAKWLINDADKTILDEVFLIRSTTSKKDPDQRQQELREHISATTLALIAQRPQSLAQSSFGCIFVTETLLATTRTTSTEQLDTAKNAIASLASGSPLADDHIARNPFANRMLKTLVAGGSFSAQTKLVEIVEPRLEFANTLYPVIKDHLVEWACSDSSFVIVALLESEDVSDVLRSETRAQLEKGRKKIAKAAKARDGKGAEGEEKKKKNSEKEKGRSGNAGAKILLEKLV